MIGKAISEIDENVVNAGGEDDTNEYFLRKNHLYKIKCSKTKDEIEGVGVINFKQPLPQFDTAFSKAYAITRKHDNSSNSNEIYAALLDKKYPIRLAEITRLVSQHFDHMVNIIAAQVISNSVSKGRVFAVVIEKPKGITLSNYLKKNGALNTDYVSKTMVPAIVGVISTLAKLNITHGKINADNIYVDEEGFLTLGECVSEICGYSQPLIYESIDRVSALPVGKGLGSAAVDYYAMGVLVAIALRGVDPVLGKTEEEILNRKFEDGAYKIVTETLEIPAQLVDLLRGVLNEKTMEVWNSEKLQEWVKGRRFNLLPPADSNETGRPIVFNGKKYRSRKFLAHDLYRNWEEGKKYVKQDTIIRWIDRNAQDSDIVERLQMASNRYGKDKDINNFDKDDQILAQYILILDPFGPFRIKEFAANIDGIGASLADSFAHNKRHAMDAIENIILHKLPALLLDMYGIDNSNAQEAAFALQKCAELLQKKDIGFGLERCLYELNPTLPCQSPLILDDICFTKEELILGLNSNENIGGQILDRHMSAFLSERMDLLVKIYVSSLARFPEFAINMYIQVLALLSLTQQTGNVGALPKLSKKIYDGLKNVIDEFHSKTLRNEIDASLQKVIQRGVLANILRIISDPKFLVKDRIGFRRALSRYKSNAIMILKLSNTRAVNNIGYRYGLQLAVMLSFFVATVEIIILMVKAF